MNVSASESAKKMVDTKLLRRQEIQSRKILNDKWVLWTSFFNSNLLCFFPFYLLFDYISVSHSFVEWTANHEQRRRRRQKKWGIASIRIRAPHSQTHTHDVDGKNTRLRDHIYRCVHAHCTLLISYFFLLLFIFVGCWIFSINLNADGFRVVFPHCHNKYIEMKMLMHAQPSIAHPAA